MRAAPSAATALSPPVNNPAILNNMLITFAPNSNALSATAVIAESAPKPTKIKETIKIIH